MENDFALMKSKFIEKYNLARPIMTILGDEVRQEILLTLIEAGGTRRYPGGRYPKTEPCFTVSSISSS